MRLEPKPNFIAKHGSASMQEATEIKEVLPHRRRQDLNVGSSSVKRLAPISCPWGMSPFEVRLLSEAVHHLTSTDTLCLYAVVGDALLDLDELAARSIVHKLKTRIGQEQGRAGLPKWSLLVFESNPALHANLVFVAPSGFDSRLRTWRAFHPYLTGEDAVQPVTDPAGLIGYLAKERTSQADYALRGTRLGTRARGSHRLGEGGGDRVVPSPALRDELIKTGRIKAYKRTKSRILRRRPATLPTTAYQDAPLFNELPVAPRFNDEFARTIRSGRERLGLSQAEFGARLGIKRAHVANVERLHARLSPVRARFALHLLGQSKQERHAT